MNPEARINNVRAQLRAMKLDGLLVSLPANITYLTAYPSRDSYLLVSRKGIIYFTDSRYTAEARAALGGRVSVRQTKDSVFGEIAETACRSLRLKSIGFEERHLPYAEYNKIKGCLDYDTVLIPTHGIVSQHCFDVALCEIVNEMWLNLSHSNPARECPALDKRYDAIRQVPIILSHLFHLIFTLKLALNAVSFILLSYAYFRSDCPCCLALLLECVCL